MIPHLLYHLAEEKPDPEFYVCTDGFDPVTGGRFLSREERQIARRMELYERIGKTGGMDSLVSGEPSKDERSSSGTKERSEDAAGGARQTWFGVLVGRD